MMIKSWWLNFVWVAQFFFENHLKIFNQSIKNVHSSNEMFFWLLPKTFLLMPTMFWGSAWKK